MTNDTTTVYSGRVTNWALFWTMNVLAVALFAMSGLPHVSLVPVLVAAVVLVVANLTLTSVRTTAGPGGVVVHYGVFGVPRFRYARDRIAGAEAVHVPFSRMGGWGVHWSPWRGTRLTIRAGASLRLTLTNGRSVTISATDPDTAAAVIHAQLMTD